MKLGRVIGRVVSTVKLESLEGLKLLLVQPLDEKGKEAGPAIVAFDTVRAGEGDLIFYESGKEAAQANPNGWFNPADAAIIGIVDAVNLRAGGGTGEDSRGGAPG
jgi:ethanolamine utilization protein EutN